MIAWLKRLWQALKHDPMRDYQKAKDLLKRRLDG
jgi:hypothetical protein